MVPHKRYDLWPSREWTDLQMNNIMVPHKWYDLWPSREWTDLQMDISMAPHKWYDLWPSREWTWLTNGQHYGPTQMIWFVTIERMDWLTSGHHYSPTQMIWFVTIKIILTYKWTTLWSHTNDMICDHQENGPDLQMDISMVPHKWYDLWLSREWTWLTNGHKYGPTQMIWFVTIKRMDLTYKWT